MMTTMHDRIARRAGAATWRVGTRRGAAWRGSVPLTAVQFEMCNEPRSARRPRASAAARAATRNRRPPKARLDCAGLFTCFTHCTCALDLHERAARRAGHEAASRRLSEPGLGRRPRSGARAFTLVLPRMGGVLMLRDNRLLQRHR